LLSVDGHGLRRVTREGSNALLGWTRLAPLLPPARAVPHTERVLSRTVLTTRAPILDVAADGTRAAFASSTTPTDCRHVAVWTPALRSVARLPDVPAPCGEISIRDGIGWVTLAGTPAAWIETGGGNTLQEDLFTATLVHTTSIPVASAAQGDDGSGTSLGGIGGDGALVAFAIDVRCSVYKEAQDTCPPNRRSSHVTAATVYRIGGTRPCPVTWRTPPNACTAVAKADGRLSVLAVDAGRIAVRSERGVRLLTGAGRVIRDFAVEADAAALSWNRLAVRTADAIELYDIDSGRLAARIAAPAAVTLQDVERDILVTASGRTVTLRRLGDGRTAAIEATGRARAQLEQPGLHVAGARRLTSRRCATSSAYSAVRARPGARSADRSAAPADRRPRGTAA
jgi:hypothetical protein